MRCFALISNLPKTYCSITNKDQDNGSIFLASDDPELYKEKVSKSIKFGLNVLNQNHPGTKIIITPTMGVDLARCNNQEEYDPETQTALNNIIVQVNKKIVELNQEGVQISWISVMVHRCKGKGKWAHRSTILATAVTSHAN